MGEEKFMSREVEGEYSVLVEWSLCNFTCDFTDQGKAAGLINVQSLLGTLKRYNL